VAHTVMPQGMVSGSPPLRTTTTPSDLTSFTAEFISSVMFLFKK
jgi:hypothetical protein